MAAPDEPWSELATYSSCAHITADAVAGSLRGFELVTEKDIRWIAAACRKAFFSTVGGYADDHSGTRVVRDELVNIRESLANTISKLGGRSDFAESVLRRFSVFDDWSLDRNTCSLEELMEESLKDWRYGGNAYLRELSPKWKNFDDAVGAIADVERYVAGAINLLCSRSDPPRWRDAERRKERIGFAVWLSAVFETTYGKPATINNWSDSEGNMQPGAWPDFFDRIGCLSLKIPKIPDLPGVLKAARKQYLAQPRGTFPPTFPDEVHP